MMPTTTINIILLLSPLFFILTAIASWFQSGYKPRQLKKLSTFSAILSIMIAAIGCFFVVQNGLIESPTLGYKGLGFSFRLDALSMIMFSMIALLGFIVLKFSNNYLDGDQRQGAFLGRLAATIASVQALVLAGNLGLLLLAWIMTSISLHRLLVFYHDRPGARIAARKKFILARLGDLCLTIAVALLYSHFGSGNLEYIFNSIQESSAPLPFAAVEGPAIFLVLAAVLKSAQFPTHGWLIEVMETPTPVSALLHAGLLNAGPFLIIRSSMILDASSIAPMVLMSIGGLTALFGSVVFMTQTSVKTALGFSSVAHMGFSLMTCGLGAYSAAMLHMVAHSFYKAHSFLSSGSVIDLVRASKVIRKKTELKPIHILSGISMALLLYAAFAFIWKVDPQKDMALIFIGAIIIMGVSRIFISSLGVKGNRRAILQGSAMGIVVLTAFFSLESAMHYLLGSQLPAMGALSGGTLVLAAIFLLLFTSTVIFQIIAPQLSKKASYQALVIHIRNGFYANAAFDRLIGALHFKAAEKIDPITEANELSGRTEMFSLLNWNKQLIKN